MKYNNKKSILIFIAAIIGVYAILNGLNLNEISLHFVSTHTDEISSFIQNHFTVSLLIYFALYVLLLSLGFPMGAILAIISGYFYTLSIGIVITLISALFTSVLTFYLGKHFLYHYLHKRHKKKIKKIQKAVSQNAISYVLAVRISSVLPFFWVNLFFGAANLAYKPYIWATFFGLIPGTAVYVNMGVSLSSLSSIEDIFSFKIMLSFLFLALLILLPIGIKKIYPHVNT
jgi:uncharacterized membrane protein YdjX (TVP38/TMEM64 family)